MKNQFRVIEGKRDLVEMMCKRLGEQALKRGEQWANHQIGPKGEHKLLVAFRRILPGLGESIVKIVAPTILSELGQKALAQEADEETISFLAHILEYDEVQAKRTEREELAEEISHIEKDLALISRDWTVVFDTEGHYIDVVAQPNMPTSVELGQDGMVPKFTEVNVATIYMEEPKCELELNARFICQAPIRIRRLLDLLAAKV